MKPWMWPAFIVFLLAIPIAAHAWLLRQALSDDGFAPEPNAYRHAVAWDSHLAEEQRNAALGWQVSASVRGGHVHVHVLDRAGQPLEAAVTARVWPLTQPKLVREIRGADGELTTDRPGLYALDVQVVRGADRFHSLLRAERTQP